MRTLQELVSLKFFIKGLIDSETLEKDRLTNKIFSYCPVDVAKNIISKIENGQDPSSVVTAFINWNKGREVDYGTVKWVD